LHRGRGLRGLFGVHHQVQENLMELIRIPLDDRQIGFGANFDGDLILAERMLLELEDPLDQIVEPDPGAARCRRPGEREQTLDDMGGATGLLVHELDLPPAGVVGGAFPQ
jgi:hypothetical protein